MSQNVKWPRVDEASGNMHMDRVDSANTSATFVRPHFKVLLISAVALIILIAVMRAWVCWSNDRYLEFSAGVYIGLAADLKSGLFYRPLFGPVGYGGTRYFPLYFVLYSLLLKLGVPVLSSGYLLSGAAIVLLIVGTVTLTRRLGAEPWLAACSGGAVLAGYSVQWSLLSPHADGLACALNVWGLAVSAGRKPNSRKMLLVAALFTLAWSTKITTVSGVAATFLWLMFAGFSRMAWALAAETACGYLMAGGAIFIFSQGRILPILKACASGGTNLTAILSGPFRMLSTAIREDVGFILFSFLALLAVSVKSLRTLPALFFVVSVGVTALIFGSPGTNFNQLVDIQVAATILFTAWIANKGAPLSRELGIYALALAICIAAVPALHKFKVEDRLLPAHRFERVIALIGNTQKPILAENPALPVLAGQRLYVMDPWMVRLLAKRTPNFSEPLLEGLRHQSFGAVVLFMRDPRTDDGRMWYEKDNFGPGFLLALGRNYRLASIIGGQFVYLPTTDMSLERGAPGPFPMKAESEVFH